LTTFAASLYTVTFLPYSIVIPIVIEKTSILQLQVANLNLPY